MTKTKYYDLQMDDPQDDYDVEVVNANLKKIDEQMKTRENATDALQEPEFTVADKRENIASKEKMQKILGKIAKFFTDLKTVAFTGSYKDLSNKPTSLPASDVSAWAKESTKPKYTKAEVGLGNVDNTADANKSVKYAASAGNATKVNNYTVNANVPSDAKFTDTTYGVATTTKTGIVKPDGKTITADKDGTLHGADTIKVDGITITRDDATKVIALAKTLQDKIGTIGNKVDKNYVVNNLTTTKQGFVLDGRQGKALQDQITSLNGSLNKADENALGNWMVGYSVLGAGFVIPIPSINNISLSNKKVKIFTTSGWQECTSQPNFVSRFGSGYNVVYNKGLPENLEIGKAFLCQFISRS